MIRILSGSTVPAGATRALVNLCNAFNSRGIDSILYGPDAWHRDRCRSAPLSGFVPERGDVVIVHDIKLLSWSDLREMSSAAARGGKRGWRARLEDATRKFLVSSGRPRGIMLVLTCQGDERFPLGDMKHSMFDRIHFLGDGQARLHKNLKRPYFVCPNFIDERIGPKPGPKPPRVAGIIGSVRDENRVDRSMENAMRDGMDPVVLYGDLYDPIYYYRVVRPLAEKHSGKIRYAGFVDDRQKMYDSVSDVYCADDRPWSMTRRECRITGTRFHGADGSTGDPPGGEAFTSERIFDVWKAGLGL